MKRYKVDDSYFDNLNSEGPAYWLGALTADGYTRNNRIEFVISRADEYWLRLFKRSLGLESPIFRRKRDGCVGISFSSEHVSSVLRKYGFTQKKSLIATFCREIPEKQTHHYIRGLIDGDGSICRCGRGCKVEIAGTHDIVSVTHSHLRNCLTYESKVKGQSIFKVGNIHVLRYGGLINLKRITDYLYHDASLFLNRKRNGANRILSDLNPALERNKLHGIQEHKLQELHSEFGTWKNVADFLNIHIRNLHKYRQKLIYHV